MDKKWVVTTSTKTRTQRSPEGRREQRRRRRRRGARADPAASGNAFLCFPSASVSFACSFGRGTCGREASAYQDRIKVQVLPACAATRARSCECVHVYSSRMLSVQVSH